MAHEYVIDEAALRQLTTRPPEECGARRLEEVVQGISGEILVVDTQALTPEERTRLEEVSGRPIIFKRPGTEVYALSHIQYLVMDHHALELTTKDRTRLHAKGLIIIVKRAGTEVYGLADLDYFVVDEDAMSAEARQALEARTGKVVVVKAVGSTVEGRLATGSKLMGVEHTIEARLREAAQRRDRDLAGEPQAGESLPVVSPPVIEAEWYVVEEPVEPDTRKGEPHAAVGGAALDRRRPGADATGAV